MPKFVTVCEGGNVRSVSMAFLLKEAGYEAIAIGWRYVTPETIKFLNSWADYFVLMQSKFLDKMPEEIRGKCIFIEVGEDRYGYAFHPELIEQCKAGLDWIQKYTK